MNIKRIQNRLWMRAFSYFFHAATEISALVLSFIFFGWRGALVTFLILMAANTKACIEGRERHTW